MSTPEPLSSPMPEVPTAAKRVEAADIDAVENTTRILRALDHERGGGRCLDTVMSVLPAADALLDVPATTAISARLRTAVADLHNLAGWVCFDTGLHHDSVRQFGRALDLAGTGELAANVRYRLGRVFLHHDASSRASEEFLLGGVATGIRGSALTTAILCANQAWAQAKMGARDEALTHIARATEEFEQADPAAAPVWSSFFTSNDLLSMTGVVHAELARTVDPRFAGLAVPALSAAALGYGPDMARSKAFCLIALATAHFSAGRPEAAAVVGHEAVELCSDLASVRTTDRLLVLGEVAQRFDNRLDVRGLVERIRAFRRTTT